MTPHPDFVGILNSLNIVMLYVFASSSAVMFPWNCVSDLEIIHCIEFFRRVPVVLDGDDSSYHFLGLPTAAQFCPLNDWQFCFRNLFVNPRIGKSYVLVTVSCTSSNRPDRYKYQK
jgi:hypothetical protein